MTSDHSDSADGAGASGHGVLARAACARMSTCPMFPEFRNHMALRILQTLYCEGAFETCARFTSMEGGVAPPSNMLPDGRRLVGGRAVRSEEGDR